MAIGPGGPVIQVVPGTLQSSYGGQLLGGMMRY